MRADDLDFELPPELIAQEPAPDRSASRLLHYRRADRSITHRHFSDLPRLLNRGDLLVLNDSRVLPARFMLQKNTGGKVEGLFICEHPLAGTTEKGQPRRWQVLLRHAGPTWRENVLHFVNAPEISVRIEEKQEAGEFRIAVDTDQPAAELLQRIGRMPLPPYIKREKEHDPRDAADQQRYQTVYARAPGSVAAPTAGLHFTPQVFDELDRCGIGRTFITLDVGLGTFKPVAAQTLEEHKMHTESYTISAAAAEALNRVKAARASHEPPPRIIAVGTTSARVLESQPADAPFEATSASTSIFIYPPYRWKHVEGLITNFHLPRSTLIALVAAMVSLDEQRRVYAEAIAERYRFFSYGDAMFIE